MGVSGIALHLGVAESQVRACLDELAELSMLYPATYSANPVALNPEIGLAALLNRRETEIQSQQAQLAAARTKAAELAAVYSAQQGSRGNLGLEQLDEITAVRARLTEMADQAREELLCFMPGGAQSQEALDASRPLDEKSLSRGSGSGRSTWTASATTGPPPSTPVGWPDSAARSGRSPPCRSGCWSWTGPWPWCPPTRRTAGPERSW